MFRPRHRSRTSGAGVRAVRQRRLLVVPDFRLARRPSSTSCGRSRFSTALAGSRRLPSSSWRSRRSPTSPWRIGARRSATTTRCKTNRTRKNPRAVLARLGPTPRGAAGKGADAPARKAFSARSRRCGARANGATRRVNYMHAMEQLHQQFPDDDEVTTFYAVALLSAARALDDNDVPLRDEGGRAGDGRLQAQSEASGRAALRHPRIRRSDSCAAGA